MKDAALAVITILKAYAPITTITQTRIYKAGDIPAAPTKPFIAVAAITRTRSRKPARQRIARIGSNAHHLRRPKQKPRSSPILSGMQWHRIAI